MMASFAARFLLVLTATANGFSPIAQNAPVPRSLGFAKVASASTTSRLPTTSSRTSQLGASNDPNDTSSALTMVEQQSLGISGTVAALVVFVSEYTLFSTGCGLPAGPLGLYGFVEGIGYLGVVGVAGYSLYKKVKTGSGLSAGPLGLLGAAEGLSFLAIAVGLVVLAFQVINYGYIPNAVPMEGGMCS